MPAPRALVLRAPGTNCDREVSFALELAGAAPEKIHVAALHARPSLLREFQILVLPGGFSYGDDAGAGKILASQLEHDFRDILREFRAAENLILGICNGFQTLVKAGLLMPHDEDGPLATLTTNTQGRYVDRWSHLSVTPNQCVFLKGVERMYLPVAHGEGNFTCRKDWIRQGLQQAGQIVLRYTEPDGQAGPYPHNPNGSQDDIAGICDATGRVFGLMPHPERHIFGTHHPHWTRSGLKPEGDGMLIFRNAVRYFA